MTKNKITIVSAISVILISLATLVNAEEPSRPYTDASFSADKEAKINTLKDLDVKDAIGQIKGVDFIIEGAYIDKATYAAFADRSEEAIDTALDLLKLPRVEIGDNKRIDRSQDMFVAKRILQVFPEGSLVRISALYDSSGATMKGNLIQALGNMSGSEPRNMLIAALDDKTFCEEKYPEMDGEPMRICDVAYNQLVLRYMVPDVLRTIGSVYTLEQRDYHILVLKEKL